MNKMDNITFKEAKEDYDKYGDQLVYRTLTEATILSDMSNKDIKFNLKECDRPNLGIGNQQWVHIFGWELNNRRFNKIEKLKNNIV